MEREPLALGGYTISVESDRFCGHAGGQNRAGQSRGIELHAGEPPFHDVASIVETTLARRSPLRRSSSCFNALRVCSSSSTHIATTAAPSINCGGPTR